MLTTFVNALMSAEVDALCGAPYGCRGPDWVNVRNGYRHRDFDTRAGTLGVAVPKLRSGSYIPDWLLERRRRAEAARGLTAGEGAGDLAGLSLPARSCQLHVAAGAHPPVICVNAMIATARQSRFCLPCPRPPRQVPSPVRLHPGGARRPH
jgi:hypothetical protein